MKMCGFIDPPVSITSTLTIENITHTTCMQRFLYPMRDNHSHALQQTISHTKGICMYCRFWKVYNIPVSLLHTPNILIVSLFAYSDRAEYISAWIPYFVQHIPIRHQNSLFFSFLPSSIHFVHDTNLVVQQTLHTPISLPSYWYCDWLLSVF